MLRFPSRFFRANQNGFSMVELLCILGVLAGLLVLAIPVYSRLRSYYNMTQCLHNLRTLSVVSLNYSNDHNGVFPPNHTGGPIYSNALVPAYLYPIPGTGTWGFKKSPLVCPAQNSGSSTDHKGVYTPTSYKDPATGKTIKYGLSYAQNAPKDNLTYRWQVEQPSKMALYFELEGHYVTSISRLTDKDARAALSRRHAGNVNVAFVDGSVRSVPLDEIPTTSTSKKVFWVGKGD